MFNAKFAFIVVCFAIALFSYPFCCDKKNWIWLVFAMAFTVGADYFLVIENWHLSGVLVFCGAHICYISRVLKPSHKLNIFRVLVIIAAIWLFRRESLTVLAGLYATLFITNIVLHAKFCKINKPLVLMGLVLFLLCDINVALFNLPRHFDISFTFAWAFPLIWIFYLPSQLLLSVSAIAFPRAKE